ncbi:MAG TPA: GAF domain-containing protein, partial [Acidobacteriota bacterium]|nr:GAF domain-containing protein [Acidobacteriota bacterium]
APLCLLQTTAVKRWQPLDGMVDLAGFAKVERVKPGTSTGMPPWAFLFYDAQLACVLLAEKTNGVEEQEAFGLIRFDHELVSRMLPRLFEAQTTPLHAKLAHRISASNFTVEHLERRRSAALERFSEYLATALPTLTKSNPPVMASAPPPLSIPYIEELLGLSGDTASGMNTAAMLSRVVNATAQLTDYQLVLVSLFREEFPYRDIIGCEALSLEVIERLKRTPFTRDEFRSILRSGVQIRVGTLGFAVYFPPTHHHLLDKAPLYKSLVAYEGGDQYWNKDDELFVPIIGQNGEYLGVISLDDPRTGRAPDEQSLLPVIAFARQISMILERQRVESEMERMLYQLSVNNSELAGLNMVLETTSRSMDRQSVLDGALKTLEVVDLEAAVILTLDESRQQLELEHASNIPDSFIKVMYEFGIECFTVGLKIMRGELEIHDVANLVTSSPRIKQAIRQESVQTLVSIPLFSRNGVLGVMVMWSHDKRQFSSQDARLLLNIGKQVGLAIEATHLFERSQRLASQMKALFEVGKSITYHLALEPLLDSVTMNAGTLLSADQVSVILLDENQTMTAIANWSRPKTGSLSPEAA